MQNLEQFSKHLPIRFVPLAPSSPDESWPFRLALRILVPQGSNFTNTTTAGRLVSSRFSLCGEGTSR